MKLIILGSGVWVGNRKKRRQGHSIFIEIDNKKILVDTPPSICYQLAEANIPSTEIDMIFLTHLHPDHFLGLPMLLGEYYQISRTKEVVIYGPKGTQQFLDNTLEIFKGIFSVFKQYWKFELKINEIEEGIILNKNNLLVEGYELYHHRAPFNNYGYKFTKENKSISITGDTGYCEALERLAKGSELLICECSSPQKIDMHLSPQDIIQLSNKVNLKEIILVHIYPELDEDEIINQIRQYYKGKVSIAEDMQTILL